MENSIITFAMFALVTSPLYLIFLWIYDKRARPKRYQARYIAALENLRQEAAQRGRDFYLLLEANKVDVDAFTVGGTTVGKAGLGYLAGKAAESLGKSAAGEMIDARIDADINATISATARVSAKTG